MKMHRKFIKRRPSFETDVILNHHCGGNSAREPCKLTLKIEPYKHDITPGPYKNDTMLH